jgi:hypothetical protein
VTSDTSDIRSPIPLTAAGVQMRPVVSLMNVLCNLSLVNAWQTPCPRSKCHRTVVVAQQKPCGNHISECAKP